ncbi:MAG: hypothetical protein HY023_12780, partial [Chloroflexi bacterium]|nr:hypothetical protein [Chloroflexota bacterium]
AVKRGDKELGAELLIRATEADPRSEQAWVWLSLAVDAPEDKLVALENVLAINPNNVPARDQARWWRQKIAGESPGAASAHADESPHLRPVVETQDHADAITSLTVRESPAPQIGVPSAYAPAARAEETDDGIDDPYQCAYCGRSTDPVDRRCPHCGRNLMMTRPASARASGVLKTATFFVGMLFATGLFEILPPLIARFVSRGADVVPYQVILRYPGAELMLGNFLNWSGSIATGLLVLAVARAAIMLILTVGLFARSSSLYYVTIVVLILDVMWNFYRAAAGYAGSASAVGDVLMALAALPMVFAADRDFHVVRARLTVLPDTHLRGATAFYKAGHAYRKLGMWAMAVAQWRQAVGAQPREVLYYKDLGVGYAQIDRFDRSLRVLEEAARQAPGDPEIPEIVALVRARQDKAEEKRK